jgi:cobalt-zinc-cadmium efflux system membrane fusion protein
MALNVPLMESAKTKAAGKDLNRYEIRAPFNGWILERDIVIGEATQPDARVFTLGNLDTVWVDLNVYPKDLDRISVGQEVKIVSTGKQQDMLAKIIYVRPIVSEESRSTVVRAILNNRNSRWQPGLFVSGEIVTDSFRAPVVIQKSALQNIRNQTVVFVEKEDRFFARHVVLGKGDAARVEIIEGLVAGEHYVSQGAFNLKSELEKAEAE